MPAHKHAEAMIQYAEDARETCTPWLRWEVKNDGSPCWTNLISNPTWHQSSEYRRKPLKVCINGVEIPRPITSPLENGQRFYCASLTSTTLAEYYYWEENSRYCIELLTRRLIHLDAESAKIHAQALMKANLEI